MRQKRRWLDCLWLGKFRSLGYRVGKYVFFFLTVFMKFNVVICIYLFGLYITNLIRTWSPNLIRNRNLTNKWFGFFYFLFFIFIFKKIVYGPKNGLGFKIQFKYIYIYIYILSKKKFLGGIFQNLAPLASPMFKARHGDTTSGEWDVRDD